MKDSRITEAQIDQAREGYKPVAFRASLLFFCIIDMAIIDPMYQYSLQYFEQIFERAVDSATASNVLETRLENLNGYFTYSLYENVCRSLFEKHKLLFSFSMCLKILQGKGAIDAKEFRYLMAGPTGDIKVQANPSTWYPENSWSDLYRQMFCLNQLHAFVGILKQFMEKPDEWKEIFDAANAHELPLPAPWHDQLNSF